MVGMTAQRIGPVVAAVAAIAGLCVSTVLLVDSVGPAPAFCAEGGCATVRATAWARPLGVPMPVVGLALFAALLGMILAGPRLARARLALATAGGVGALALLAVQGAVIGAWCKFCVVADASAIVIAAAMWLGRGATWPARRGSTWMFAALLAAVAIGVPLRGLRSPDARPVAVAAEKLPDSITTQQVAGVVTIVDYIDFECPFCRALHARLTEAIARAGVPTRVVRKMVPLSMHPGALPAAIAWCCAELQGKADAMAEALIAAPPAQLTPAGCEQLAASIGLDLARYRRDAGDPAIKARIDADVAASRALGVRSLPTLYIGAEVFSGARATTDDLIASIRRAAG